MLDSGCRAGNCGSRVTAIERGLVTYLVEPGKKPDDKSCFTCVTVPQTDLTLDGKFFPTFQFDPGQLILVVKRMKHPAVVIFGKFFPPCGNHRHPGI